MTVLRPNQTVSPMTRHVNQLPGLQTTDVLSRVEPNVQQLNNMNVIIIINVGIAFLDFRILEIFK